MHVPSYQIHNVLKLYSRQITLERFKDIHGADPDSENPAGLSAEGKRESMIQKITSDIVEKITRDGSQEADSKGMPVKKEKNTGESRQDSACDAQTKEFIYNTLDDQNRKTTHRVSLEGAEIVLKRLDTF
ncbi:hypothetical protein LZ24_01953 [Desulfobotulus alkaliphilus]|uniref:Uncharacterized protein n=1 Tax=Desulfobotulus alkaliphilus TaxID=622671 RepID=A0A562RTM3_9BACT|nr:DVU0524 family FlgM-associated protein [Desulfobotulus alkaliphilus]TWI71680.1 hypothetical protein LZ24_01953 [Desulfobotulus alkaliphilus]